MSALQLNNVTTSDDYSDANSISDFEAQLLEIDVNNAAVVAQLKRYDQTGKNNDLNFGEEFLIQPVVGKQYANCSGFRVKSAVAGVPAQVSARLYLPSDPQPLGGAPTDVSLTTGGGIIVPTAGVVTGAITAYAGVSIPPGFLLCDGSAVSRSTYAALFTALGTTYGVGDGSTTFNLPDLRGRAAVGVGPHGDVAALGEAEGQPAASRSPRHVHSVNDPTHTHLTAGSAATTSSGGNSLALGPNSTGDIGRLRFASTGITVGPAAGAFPSDTIAYLALQYLIAI